MPAKAPVGDAVVAPPGRYGAGRAINLPVIVMIVLIHVVAITAMIQVRQHVIKAREAKLTVVNLTPPPPPPAQEAPPPPPTKPEVVAPPPIVQTPRPPVQIATTPDPAPRPTPVAFTSTIVAPAAPPVMAAPPNTVQAGDLSARMLSGKAPRYPIESRRKREQGTVILSLTLGLDGRVASISITRSSGFPRLDDAARDAVRGWRWAPTVRGGTPVMVKGVVEIPFVLQG
ncbi:energy transducer TonB [Sphingobium sp. AN641]|uniref:energy transducer TonB n=1 Tax=Sphingobium sp. AN641 TaxID=3133443 RepID=UPI0030C054C9